MDKRTSYLFEANKENLRVRLGYEQAEDIYYGLNDIAARFGKPYENSLGKSPDGFGDLLGDSLYSGNDGETIRLRMTFIGGPQGLPECFRAVAQVSGCGSGEEPEVARELERYFSGNFSRSISRKDEEKPIRR